MGTTKNNPSTADREIVITRVINASRERVFEAMTDIQQVAQWWGPTGFTTTIHKMDVRPGGVWEHTMKGPDGAEYINKSVFVEIVKPERIVFSHGGGKIGDEDRGVSFKATWTFEAEGENKTKVTLRSVFLDAESRDRVVKQFNAIEGGKQTLGRLDEHMKGPFGKPFVVSRTFDAPRPLVWKAWTEPERMSQWWGPKDIKTHMVKMELRVGGMTHYSMDTPDGKKIWGRAVYREITPPERLVFVNNFSDEKGGLTRHPLSPTWPVQMLTTVTFEEEKGKTVLTIRWVPIDPTPEEQKMFDEAHPSMKQGWGGSLDKLTGYLGKA